MTAISNASVAQAGNLSGEQTGALQAALHHARSLQPDPVSGRARKRRRLSFGLTPRTMMLLAAGMLLALPGFFNEVWAYGMLVWDAIVLAAVVFDGLRLPTVSEIEAKRSWSNAPALDSQTEIELELIQRGETIVDCFLVDDLPPALVLVPATHRLRAYPNVPTTLRYSFQPLERGDTTTGDLYVRYRSLLGLLDRWVRIELKQLVRVYPRLRQGEDQNLYLTRGRQLEMQLRRLRQRGLGRDFESLREYREGDDLRDICWTATARRGEMITRQYQVERSQPVWIVLDAGRLLRGRVEPQSAQAGAQTATQAEAQREAERIAHSKLDYACSTAIAMAHLALYSGDRVGLLVYGQSIQQRILPGRGSSHLRQIAEALSQARVEAAEADHLRATAVLSRLQPRRSMILWVTDLSETAMRPEAIDGALQLLRRHVLLFVAMGQPDVEAIARRSPKSVDEMFEGAAARELIGRRHLLLAKLREQGALTLDLHPEKLTAAVLNQYLAVKEKAML